MHSSSSWTLEQVAQHNSFKYVHPFWSELSSDLPSSSCWVIIKTNVYDVTDFLQVLLLQVPRAK
jgi:cytochrome b involved in lipid metabolism